MSKSNLAPMTLRKTETGFNFAWNDGEYPEETGMGKPVRGLWIPVVKETGHKLTMGPMVIPEKFLVEVPDTEFVSLSIDNDKLIDFWLLTVLNRPIPNHECELEVTEMETGDTMLTFKIPQGSELHYMLMEHYATYLLKYEDGKFEIEELNRPTDRFIDSATVNVAVCYKVTDTVNTLYSSEVLEELAKSDITFDKVGFDEVFTKAVHTVLGRRDITPSMVHDHGTMVYTENDRTQVVFNRIKGL